MPTIFTNKELPKRVADDVYVTPRGFIEAALDVFPTNLNPDKILDPGAGPGGWGQAARELWPDSYIIGVEKREVEAPIWYDEYHAPMSFLVWPTDGHIPDNRFDLIIGNPPFDQIEEFINHGLKLLKEDGYLGFLARLSFLEGIERCRNMWADTPLFRVYVSSRRIGFLGHGKSQPRSMAFYIWKIGYNKPATLHWLDWVYVEEDRDGLERTDS